MIDEKTALIIASTILGPGIIVIINRLYSMKKDNTEVQNLSITGEISVISTYKTLVTDLKTEMAEMRTEMKEMKIQFATIVAGKDEEIKTIKEKNKALEERVDILEAELEKYKGVNIDKVAEIAHNAVNVATAQVKEDLK